MATVTKTVDKTLVNGSETFIYTINISYSGLTKPAQNGKLVDFFPDKIVYKLPQPGGQLDSITETRVSGGTNVEFNFGSVNAGTSLSFTVACSFGPGRVDGDSFTNNAKLYADNTVVATGAAPTVNLKLDENFTLFKSPNIREPVRPGQLITFDLSLQNVDDMGAEIKNIVIKDVMPPQLIPDTSFTPVGNEQTSSSYSDTRYNGRTGSWNGNTLEFTLPSYKGAKYVITFKAKVAESVTPGETIKNTAVWTVDGKARKDATSTFSVFKDKAKASLYKRAPEYAEIGKPIQYSISTTNAGTVPLTNYVLTDTLPPEVDITKISLFSYEVAVPRYDLYIETSDLPGTYKIIASDLSGNSGVYDLTPFTPSGKRVLSVRVVFASVAIKDSSTVMYLYGTVNNTALPDQVIVNTANVTAKSTIGDVTVSSSGSTTLNGKSTLELSKYISPNKSSYYPLDELVIKLVSSVGKGNIYNPIFADLLPLGLEYVPGNDYFGFFDSLKGSSYDSRQPGFPIPMPETEVIKNYKGSGRTLVRFRFNDFVLLYGNSLSVNFGVLVTLNPPSSFVNMGYLGNPGDNAQVINRPYTDTMDFDGDGIVNESIAESNQVTGVILSTSEFSLEKWVKGNLNSEFSKASTVTDGGDIIYKLNVTNNQDVDLKNIEIVDILPYVGDTGVILNTKPRGSQFNVYATSVVTAEIINILGDPVVPTPVIKIEYSDSNDPLRFDETGNNTIGSGTWSSEPPIDITTLASVRITTDPSIVLKPYERLTVTIHAKAPVGAAKGIKAYNSYAVRADKITGGTVSKMNPAEPNKVSVVIGRNEKSSVGSFVWEDTNGNGLIDTGEPGVNGIIAELYSSDGTKLAETITSNNNEGKPGYYNFPNLPAGDYYVKFIPYGDYDFTIQNLDPENGSKANQTTGITDYFTLAENQILTTVNAGLILPPCDPPIIDAKNQCLYVGDPFDPMKGVTAVDCHGNDITEDVTVNSNVDTAEAGIYSVTYTVTDSKGQTTTKTIEVIVCAKSPHHQAVSDLFESVALEQTALSHILNAEGEKIQKAIQLDFSSVDMLKINNSVKDMTDAITRLETILRSKLELFNCHPCGDNCCKEK